jgi:hypothetical protein
VIDVTVAAKGEALYEYVLQIDPVSVSSWIIVAPTLASSVTIDLDLSHEDSDFGIALDILLVTETSEFNFWMRRPNSDERNFDSTFSPQPL